MENVQLAVDVDKITFEQEQNELVKFILNERFFKPWENWDTTDYNSLSNESCLEIFITSSCNQKCKYCYLYNNPSLYPSEINNKYEEYKKKYPDYNVTATFFLTKELQYQPRFPLFHP